MSRLRSSSYISAALDDAGCVGPPQNIPDILSSARLASAADSSPIYTTNFGDGTLTARGEMRGGRFIAGLHGEQFALPEAVEALRALRRKEPRGQYIRVSACDPLNLAGILTPGPRIPAVPGNPVIYRDGVQVAALENGQTRILAQVEVMDLPLVNRLLDIRPPEIFAK